MLPTPDETPAVAATNRVPDLSGVLDGLTGRPLNEHADVYQGLHADLQAALAEIDSA